MEDLLVYNSFRYNIVLFSRLSGTGTQSVLSTDHITIRDRQGSSSLFSLRAEGPSEALPQDVGVQLLDKGDVPLVPGPGPRPPVQHHHAPGEGPGQLHTGHRSRDIRKCRLRLTWRAQRRTS